MLDLQRPFLNKVYWYHCLDPKLYGVLNGLKQEKKYLYSPRQTVWESN